MKQTPTKKGPTKKGPTKNGAVLPGIVKLLLDPSTPDEMRIEIVRQLVHDDGDGPGHLLAVLKAAAVESSEDLHAAKAQELAELIQQMLAGPLRQATFVKLVRSEAFGLRAEVVLADGAPAFTAVPDEALADKLRAGDLVWLEAQGKALLYREESSPEYGDEARLERVLANGSVEVQMGEVGKYVFRVGAQLEQQLEAGEAVPGSTLIVCPRRRFAFEALPREEGLGHLNYLSTDAVPDVDPARDIGAPPEFIGAFERHLRRELALPGISAKYGLRRSLFRLLTGVPGTGKTFSIAGFWNRMYAVMSEVSGVPVPELPPRVMQLRVSDVLSKWVGSSDRNIARFFAEAAEVAAERLVCDDGTQLEMPLLLIVEECDAWARERGEDSIHDRIQTTLLQHLDPARPLFRDRLVFVLCTTNTPQLVDSAFVRRVGGKIETFGRMGRTSFRAVLEKQIGRRPFRLLGDDGAQGGESEAQARARCVSDLVAWYFGTGSGRGGLVELVYAGQTTPVVKHTKHFLTASLVERAVQEASAQACDAEWHGDAQAGLSSASLVSAIDHQVRGIVDQLTPRTAGRYLTLPDGARVANLRRLSSPTTNPFELERHGAPATPQLVI